MAKREPSQLIATAPPHRLNPCHETVTDEPGAPEPGERLMPAAARAEALGANATSREWFREQQG